jgi:hypothetical protein
MSEEQVVESDVQVEPEGEVDDNFGAMQDRMSGDDSPWLSDSDGKVYDSDGNILADDNGNPFTSLEDYQNALKKQTETQQDTTAKPQNTQQQPGFKPGQSFDSYAFGSDGLTQERFNELSGIGRDQVYNDELIPPIDENYKPEENSSTDPIQRIKEERSGWESIAITPIQKIRQSLIDQGGDPILVDNLLKPILSEQSSIVDKLYQQKYEEALEQKISGQWGEKFNKIDQREVDNASNANIERLSRVYFKNNGGKDAFMSLVNGHNDMVNGKSTFVRGPSAELLDLANWLVNGDKKFSTEKDRNEAYANMFKKITSNEHAAKILFGLAYNNWLGKKSPDVKKIGFEKGKQAIESQNNRRLRTMKTRPASAVAPQTSNDDPAWFKAALQAAQ